MSRPTSWSFSCYVRVDGAVLQRNQCKHDATRETGLQHPLLEVDFPSRRLLMAWWRAFQACNVYFGWAGASRGQKARGLSSFQGVVKMPDFTDTSVREVLWTIYYHIKRNRRHGKSVISISWGSIKIYNESGDLDISARTIQSALESLTLELEAIVICAAGNSAPYPISPSRSRLWALSIRFCAFCIQQESLL